MGKSLIVKGADFSLNGLDSTWNETPLVQGFVNTNSGSSSYGKILLNGTTSVNGILGKILIPSGVTMSVKVTNNDVTVTDFLVAYVASVNNVSLVDSNFVTSITTTLHPLTDSIRESDGSFTIANTSAYDLYYYIDFAYNITSGPSVSVTGKKCLYQRVMTE